MRIDEIRTADLPAFLAGNARMVRRSPRRRALCVALMAGTLLGASAAPASALDLFGWWPFGKSESEAETAVVDPFPYTPTLSLSGGNDDLKEKLESTSELVSDADRPPSGEAGLIARANSDFERLVGRLYVEGYYAGTVDIRVAGLTLEAALRMPSLPGPRPVPVTIRVSPGPLFSFGNLAVESTAQDALVGTPESYGLVRGETANSEKVLRADAVYAWLLWRWGKRA